MFLLLTSYLMLSSQQDEGDGDVGVGGEVCDNLDLCSWFLTLLPQVEDDDLDTTEEWDASAGFPAVEVSLF